MKQLLIVFALFCTQIVINAQTNYIGIFHSEDLSNPELHADGIFQFFVASDNELKFGNPEQAILILDNAIAQHPFFAETYLKRSKILARLGRHTEARRDFERAQRLNPYLGNFYSISEKSGKIKLIAFDPNHYTQASKDLLPAEVTPIIQNSVEKKLEGDMVGALVELDKVFEQLPQPEAKLYDLRGSIHLLQNDFQRAVTDYSRAIQMSPDTPEYYFNRGVAQLFTYNRSAACEDLEMSYSLGYTRSEEKLKYFCYY